MRPFKIRGDQEGSQSPEQEEKDSLKVTVWELAHERVLRSAEAVSRKMGLPSTGKEVDKLRWHFQLETVCG